MAQDEQPGNSENGSSTNEATKEPVRLHETQPITKAKHGEGTGDKFSPYDLSSAPRFSTGLPPEIWAIVQSAPANFTHEHFLEVSRDLLENPNRTSTHLARAELSYQSFTDATFNPKASTPEDLARIVKHLRPECRPQLIDGGIQGYELEYTVVRKLIPRNPKLDDSLMQTCHLFVSHQDVTVTSPDGDEETVKAGRYMVIYIPHAATPEAIPYYHPKVRSLAMLYTHFPSFSHSKPTSLISASGNLSIHYSFFPTLPIDNRLSRTALKLLEVIHKHSRGQQAGYTKRVHHDQLIGQKRFQDTYAHLKGKYAKELIEAWVEQTPAEKHVFEDLGIAAFLIELWRDMYASQTDTNQHDRDDQETQQREETTRISFPGFVDIGCGNGLLVHILNAEGWHGWGFDARQRKTWDTFPPQHTQKLKEMLLVPEIIQPLSSTRTDSLTPHHNGIFPPGTFIISNHADELTPWTPLLAHLNSSPFIAIPCCSHDFGGRRFRSPTHAKHVIPDPTTAASKKFKQPSAYASLCSWVCHLAEETGYVVEKEHLRIPSTRNMAVLGRKYLNEDKRGHRHENMEEKLEFLRGLVEQEMDGKTVGHVCDMWMKSGDGLMKTGKGGH
ncbi:tRNASer (uridine44-2'-O)-methyltransferase [Alternaria panax]|uniref:tRNA (uracil-O(2)-)-methyltransferase n=1 Tax=Alternaria panax TaxID=48097 RepID=A0AAD4I1T3_9PLEO|nr:tRNASer (uridine44-2'-O)-methyltransferase [Alternaria panax]